MTASRGAIPTGIGVAKLTPAGNAVWADEGPAFIFNKLEVEGPPEPLHEFLVAASRPGFIDWRPEWYAVYEGIYFNLMRAGMPTVQAGDKLAQKFQDIAWWPMSAGALPPRSIRTGRHWI